MYSNMCLFPSHAHQQPIRCLVKDIFFAIFYKYLFAYYRNVLLQDLWCLCQRVIHTGLFVYLLTDHFSEMGQEGETLAHSHLSLNLILKIPSPMENQVDSAYIFIPEDTDYSLVLHSVLLCCVGVLNQVKSDHFLFKFANL